jgi:hypothetical protein
MINHLIDDNTDLVYMYLISNKNIDKNYISLDINIDLIKKLTVGFRIDGFSRRTRAIEFEFRSKFP